MKKYFFIIILSLFAATASAQTTMSKENGYGIKQLRLEFRTDFDCYSYGDEISSGFTGRYLNFVIAGDITDNLYYAFRQRINKIQMEYNLFDATDYLYLGWRITKNISLTAGKEIVAMGGIEYDLAPIDVYFHSNFWDSFNCYRFGTNLEFTTNDRKNTFTFQFTNSPFDNSITYCGLYNYSLHWRGTYEHFMTSCSVNMYEYKKGCFLNVMAFGLGYDMGPIIGYIDFANRAHGDQQPFFFSDMTFVSRIGYQFMNDNMQVFVKGGIDLNDSQSIYTPVQQVYDICVTPGTDMIFYGGGLEYYPLKGRNDIRLHAFFAVSDVRNDTEIIDGVLAVEKEDKISYQANIGLTWKLKYINK